MLNKYVQIVKFYCDACDEFTEVEIGPLQFTTQDEIESPGGDILCTKCHLVISSIIAKEHGVYKFVLEMP